MSEIISFPSSPPPEADAPYYFEGPVDPLDILASLSAGLQEFRAPTYQPSATISEFPPTPAFNPEHTDTAGIM